MDMHAETKFQVDAHIVPQVTEVSMPTCPPGAYVGTYAHVGRV